MLLLAFLAATASTEAPGLHRIEIAQQARASVRIVSGARVTAEKIPDEALVREARMERSDGSQAPARLIEFP